MAELGALSLRIETTGDAAVLRTLDAIDTKAKRTDISLVNTVAALNKLGIAARQVGGAIQVADGQLEQATQIVRRLGSQAQVTAGNLAQMGAATTKAVTAPTQALNVFGRDVVQTSGKLSAFGKSGLNAFNALSFGLSQMAATGQTSFRSLATASASVLAFFGVGGAIASAVIATGLVLVDFWRRQRREIEETKQKILESLKAAAVARRERDEPASVARERLGTASADVRAAKAVMASLLRERERALNDAEREAIDSRITLQRARVSEALNVETEALRELNDAQAKSTDARDAEVASLAAAISARQATATQIARANVLMGQARFVLEQTKNANVEDTATMAGRAKAIQTLTTLTDAFKKKTGELKDTIGEEINALESLSKTRGLTAVELLRLIPLEGKLIDELARGSVTKEREAEIWEQIAKARQAAARAIPPVSVRSPLGGGTFGPGLGSTTEGVVGPPKTLAKPTGALAEFLSPERIAADVAAADKAMAERVAAFNFNETQTALSEVLGNAIATGIAFGFAHGLGEGGIGEGFKQMAAQLATGLGSVAIDYGIKAILTAQAMAKIAAFLIANPILAIGAGIALVALGRAMGGRHGAGRSFGGGGSGFSGSSGQQSSVPLSIRRLVVDPNAALRQQAAGRMSGMADATVAPSPLAGVTLLEVKSPRGTEVIGSSYDAYQRRRR
jgi:hypothetical protein